MPTSAFDGNIYLMGFMGCGKSKVGMHLADRIGWSYLDTDQCISEEAGQTIPEIFEMNGESHFRKLEKACVSKVAKLKKHVISLGGGAVVNPENWIKISQSGITVTLSYPPEIIATRLETKSDRPLLGGTKGQSRLNRIQELMEKREAFYQRADLLLHLNREINAEHIAAMIEAYIGGLK